MRHVSRSVIELVDLELDTTSQVRARHGSPRRGRQTVLYALQRLSFGLYVGGRGAALRNSSEEAVALGLSIGQHPSTAAPQAWLTLLAALQTRPDYDERLAVARSGSSQRWSVQQQLRRA